MCHNIYLSTFYVTYMSFSQILKVVISYHFKGPFCANPYLTKNWRSECTVILPDKTQRSNYSAKQLFVSHHHEIIILATRDSSPELHFFLDIYFHETISESEIQPLSDP
jgi:hypothetical protein